MEGQSTDQNEQSSPLSPAILRGLGDRSYDKRKAAALEVTTVIYSTTIIE